MRRGISVAGLLLAWLCAQGALTEGMQVCAWMRMFVGYAAKVTWRAALEETLDPNKPCELCSVVRKVRETQQQAPAAPVTSDAAKFVLVPMSVCDPELAPRTAAARNVSNEVNPTEWDDLVPTPPPRRHFG